MRSFDFGRYMLGGFAFTAMLAGCGGSQPPIGAPGAMPQTRAIATHAERARLSDAGGSNDALLYANDGCSGICIYSYPSGKPAGSLDGSGGICPAPDGSFYKLTENSSRAIVLEHYAHGATQPIETVLVDGYESLACSVDPMTGNVAISLNLNNEIAIVPNGSGTPRYYTVRLVPAYLSYDSVGNLFVDGTWYNAPKLAELRSGSDTFVRFALDRRLRNRLGQVQWDGSYITIETLFNGVAIYRLSIHGGRATVVGKTTFNGVDHDAGTSWIQGSSVVVPFGVRSGPPTHIGIWPYPAGGSGTVIVKLPEARSNLQGVTVSINPRH